MKAIFPALATASALSLALAACGGQGDDTLGERAEDAYDNQADQLDQMADNATTDAQEQALEQQADAVRDKGEAKEDAIDDSDVNADDLTAAQKNALVNGN